MAKTYTFTVNSTGSPEPIAAQTNCTRIIVGEDPSVANYPTAEFNIYAPKTTDSALRHQLAQLSEPFTPQPGHQTFDIGEIVGYVETTSGTTTFRQWET